MYFVSFQLSTPYNSIGFFAHTFVSFVFFSHLRCTMVIRDIEGSDSDSRRRAACDLVRGMCRNPVFGRQVRNENNKRKIGIFCTVLIVNWEEDDLFFPLLFVLFLSFFSFSFYL